MLRWVFAAIVLLLVGAAYGLITGESRIDDMTAQVRSELAAAGQDWASVHMDGNVVTLSGTAPDEDARRAAIAAAESAYCSACKNKHRWHEVEDATTLMAVAEAPVEAAPVIPVQSPYTFSARKAEDGSVSLSGYAPTEDSRSAIFRNAREVFGDVGYDVDDIDLARGAPVADWDEAVSFYLGNLAQLDRGRVLIEDGEGALQGTTTDPELQATLFDTMQAEAPEGFNLVGNIAVPGGAVLTFGESNSQAICQALLDDLRRGRKINFEGGEATIRGADNFTLLGEVAAAANQCPDFRIAINGYTSSDGDPDFNQALSESRANAVLSHIVQQGGIDRDRLSAEGFGESNPVADNDTQAGRMANRRIEFIITKAE